MSTYKRPLRSDELMHRGSHKYIAKIGNRYFYTAEELKAFKQGAGQKVSDNFAKLRQHAYDAAGGAAKRRSQQAAKEANEAKNKANSYSNADRLRDLYADAPIKEVLEDHEKKSKDKTKSEAYRKRHAQAAENHRKLRDDLDKRLYDDVKNDDKAVIAQRQADHARAEYKRTPVGMAESAKRSINHVKNTAAHKLESGKKRKKSTLRVAHHITVK